MKTSITLIFCFVSLLFQAQIKLTSFPIELKKSSQNHQMMNFGNDQTHEIYTFLADKESVTGIRFNRAVFFSDSLTAPKPFNYQNCIGQSFSVNNNPVLHWITEDNKKILSIEYDFSKKTNDFNSNQTLLSDELIVAAFSNNSRFYIMTLNGNDELKIFTLDTEISNFNIIDLKNISVTNAKNKEINLSELIGKYSLFKMERDFYNPLIATAEKVKYYIENNKFIIICDLQVSKSECIEIDLKTFTVTQKEFVHSNLKEAATQSNSYYLNQNLYQVKSNKNELLLHIVDYYSKETIKDFLLTEKDNPFKYSEFLIQTEHYKPQKINSTKRFLKKIDNSSIAFTLFPVDNYFLASLGSNKTTASTQGIALAIGVGLGALLTEGEFYDVNSFYNARTQSAYLDFECTQNYEVSNPKNTILATDFISGFLSEHNNISLYQTFKYREYYVLSCYDKKAKELVLYKFENQF